MPVSTSGARATLEDYRWLSSGAADRWLNATSALPSALAGEASRLRKSLSPIQTHLVLEQVALRAQARDKFSAADKMFFTPRTLEQATDEVVAAHKATRFAGRERVFDLCCGIGGDLLALAHEAPTIGFDRDEVMVTLAAANARAVFDDTDARHSLSGRPEVRASAAEQLVLAECSTWHIDPDRRPGGHRTTRVEFSDPALGAIERMLAQNPHAAIKLAPAAELPDAWLATAELEWISRARQCRQLVAWAGDLARNPGQRRATILGGHAQHPRTIVGVAGAEPPPTRAVDRYLFEPDAAVLAAKLDNVLAEDHSLAQIAPGVAYWTGSEPIRDPALACFEVLEVLPFRIKQVKELLRARRVGRLEIKKRGVGLDPAATRRELDLAGDEEATLLITSIGKRVTAIVARRIVEN